MYKGSQEGNSFAGNVYLDIKTEKQQSLKQKFLIYKFTCLGPDRPLLNGFVLGNAHIMTDYI
jgi:hypothetical protein